MGVRGPELYENLSELWRHTMKNQILYSVDLAGPGESWIYDLTLEASSMEFDFDLGKDLMVQEARFNKLQVDYLDSARVWVFLQRCEEAALKGKRGLVVGLIAKQHALTAKSYRWGNCIIGWTFRGGKTDERPKLTMHSRTAYISYIGGLDLALSWVLAREIGERIGRSPEEFEFSWKLDSSQLHYFKSIPTILCQGWEDMLVEGKGWGDSPSLKGLRTWWKTLNRKMEETELDDETFQQVKRVRRRVEEWRRGELWSVPVYELTLDALRARG